MMRRTGDERHRLGQAARERIQSHFNIDAKADELESLYKALLAQKK